MTAKAIMPNWLNNLEPVTSHQEIEGAAQSDYSQFHLPKLYMWGMPVNMLLGAVLTSAIILDGHITHAENYPEVSHSFRNQNNIGRLTHQVTIM